MPDRMIGRMTRAFGADDGAVRLMFRNLRFLMIVYTLAKRLLAPPPIAQRFTISSGSRGPSQVRSLEKTVIPIRKWLKANSQSFTIAVAPPVGQS